MLRRSCAALILLACLTLASASGVLAGASDGAWRALAPPPKGIFGSVVYDAARHRLLAVGVASDDPNVYAMPLSGARVWTRIPVLGPGPGPRLEQGVIYDPVRDRLIMFGGLDAHRLGDLWALSLADPPVWSRLAPTGPAPAPRESPTAVYDAVRDRLVIFGGFADFGNVSDTWTLPLAAPSAWHQILTSNFVTPRLGNAAAFDAIANRLVIWSGVTNSGALLTEVRALQFNPAPSDSATWVDITPPGPGPAWRVEESFAWDASRRALVVFSGECCGGTLYNDLWVLHLAGTPSWAQLTASAGPTPRQGAAGAYDPVNDRYMIVGGWDYPSGYLNDSWEIPLGTTGPWAPVVAAPASQADPPFVLDVAGSRAFTFDASSVWALGMTAEPTWSRIASPTGAPAVLRSTIFDPIRRRLLVLGSSGLSSFELSNPATWSSLVTTGSPPAFSDPAVVYDPLRDRALVFDGTATTGQGVWQLTLGATPEWSQLAVTGAPPPDRVRPMACYDPYADRLVVFGGENLNDVWQLPLGSAPAWSQVLPGGVPPPARPGSSAMLDTQRHRLVVLAGGTSPVSALSLDGPAAWTSLSPIGTQAPTATTSMMGLVYDDSGDRLFVHGGRDVIDFKPLPLNRTFELKFSGVLAVPGAPRIDGTLVFERVTPNPAIGAQRFEWSRPTESPATFEIYNVAGRLVWLGAVPTGSRQLVWDGRDLGSRRVSPGVYFAHVRSVAGGPTERIVRLR